MTQQPSPATPEPISPSGVPPVVLAPLNRRAAPLVACHGSIAHLAFGSRICFDAEKGAGAGGGEGAGAGAGTEGTAGAGAGTEGAGGGEKPARPEYVGEQFWDADKGEIKGGDFKAYVDDLAAFKAGEDSKRAAAPEKPDAYELKLPEGLDFGEGVTFELDQNDPMFGFGRQVAHDLGLDQSGFEKLVGSYAQMQVAQSKVDQAVFAQQMEQLGPKGADRQKAVETWVNAKLGPDAAVLFGGITKFKSGVETLEKVMRLASGGGAPAFTQGGRESGKLNETVQDRWFPSMRSN